MAAPTPTFLFPSMESTKQPKSPKSPKATLENPLLKNPSFLFGTNAVAPSLVPEPKSPLMSSHSNSTNNNDHHRINRNNHATPGPPPKASMSLGMKLMAPMEQPTRTPAPATPLTPPPVASPPLIWKQQEQESFSKRRASTTDNSGSSSHWIVAYGYTTRDELDELMDLMGAYGPTLQTHANGNWLAVHYEGRLAAEKALCRQPIRLSSMSLCGTVRANQQLLQGLLAQPPVPLISANNSNVNSNSSTTQRSLTTHTAPRRFSSLQEEDILAHYPSDGRTNEQGSLSRRVPTSACEKFFSWYFAWDDADVDKEAKAHLD